MCRCLASFFSVWLFVAPPAGAQESAAPPENLPPWQRLLTGEDAKEAERLVQQIVDQVKVDDFPSAVRSAESLVELRPGFAFPFLVFPSRVFRLGSSRSSGGNSDASM